MFFKGQTYSYVHKGTKDGKKCCRPIRSKCRSEESMICKIQKGPVYCGKGCERLINAVKHLARSQREKKEKGKNKKQKEKGNFQENSKEDEYDSEEEYSYEEKDEKKNEGKGEGMGLKVKKGQKMTQKQLQMLDSAAEERKISKNPLCKEEQQNNMFRCNNRNVRYFLSLWQNINGHSPMHNAHVNGFAKCPKFHKDQFIPTQES